MLRRLFSIVPTVITGVVGVIVFITFLAPLVPADSPLYKPLYVIGTWRMPLVQIAVVIAGVAVLLGFIRLISVHVQRIRRRKGIVYSFILIFSAVVTALVVIFLPGDATKAVFNDVILPMQSALGALLAIFLALAAFRMLRRRRTFGTFCFLLSALIVLITQVPIWPDGSWPMVVRQFFDAFTTGGLRGLLLGVAIGIVATAFRVLLFIDRPQSE